MLHEIEQLLDEVAGSAQAIEQQRALPEDLVTQLKAAGAFRALIPTQYGGLGAAFESYLPVIQKLARADASTAWCVNQAAVIGLTSLYLPETSIYEIWADAETSVANGPPFDCRITPGTGVHTLSGHWGFSSGCQHATRMMGAARCSAGGYRIAYFTPDDVVFEDNWQVAGLRGTGSFEFRVTDLVVPDAYVGDMAGPPTWQGDVTTVPNTLMFAVSFAAVALGVAEGAMADVVNIAQGKVPRFLSTSLNKDPDVQRFVGKARARWRAARAYLFTTVSEVMACVRDSYEITHAQRAELRMAGTHVIRECAEVVDLAYKIAGSTGIYQVSSLQRRFQDMHVITQHVQAREAYFALLGRYELSGEYEIGPMT